MKEELFMENKYGHLLDKYMDGGKKYTHSLLEKEVQEKKEECETDMAIC